MKDSSTTHGDHPGEVSAIIMMSDKEEVAREKT
jgi:hypothetical protein